MNDPKHWSRQQQLIVLSMFATLFLVFGSGFNTTGVFFDPLLRQFGWTRARLSSLQTVLGVSAGITAPFFGWLLDHVDARTVIAAGAALSGFAFMLAGGAESYQTFVLANVLLGVGIAAATLLPCSQVLANWFGSRRATALGIAMSGTSLGGMLMTLLAAITIEQSGWRTAYVVLGVPMIVLIAPLVWFAVRGRPNANPVRELAH